MKNQMTLFGCGPKLALLSLPYILLSGTIMSFYPDFLNLLFLDNLPTKIIGVLWGITGLVFWIYSAIFFIKYFKPGVLLTSGPFGFCRNPIYSSIIIFIIPATGLILHSGLVLSIAVDLFIGFKLTIHGETVVLRRIFGEAFDKYENTVNEIFPWPSYTVAKEIGN
jgi:protein-S-isoprenylcysteine O-methyltransferase Ste14